MTWYRAIEKAFCDFDVAQIRPVDISEFLEQWEGRRAAQVLLSYISMFFQWCASKGVIDTNPAREVKVQKPKRRKVLITDEQFEAVRQAAPASGYSRKDGTRIIDHDGQMLQVYMELLYLLGQRGTDVRLLRWSSISEKGIVVTPTKTESSSGKTVLLPMTAAIEKSLEKARSIQTVKSKNSEFVIHDRKGSPYDSATLSGRFQRVCKRLGIKGFTLKDIRPKMATDAVAMGYKEDELQTALVHTDTAMTRTYLRQRVVEVSHVRMELPSERKKIQPVDAGGGDKQ
jgi:integrase